MPPSLLAQPARQSRRHRAPAVTASARRLFAESAAARGYLVACVLLALTGTAMILAQAGLLARLLASAASGVRPAELAGSLTVLLVVVVVRAAANHGREVTALRAATAVKERLRHRLVRRALERGPVWLAGQRSGEITTLAVSGLDALDPYFASYLPQLLLAVCVPLAVLTAITAADWLSGVIVAVTLPVIPVFGVLIGLRTKARTQRNWQLLATLSGHFTDVVRGLTTLKIFGRAKAQEEIIGRVTQEYRASVMATLRVAFLSALVLELAASVATALVAVEVGLRLLYGHLGYSTALFVLVLTPEAFLPLRDAAARFHASADGTAVAGRVFEILDPDETAPARGTGPGPDLRSAVIRLDGVSAGYPGREPVLRGVDLTIGAGDRITLAGLNGAGKSTLISLLLKFIGPSGGQVFAGETDLALVAPEEWRAQVGWLPQFPALFPWSVLDNIALGRPGAGLADVERAAELAGAAGFIAGLPDGYDTVLDERALRLSAGQRQKLALARVFLKDAPLVLLDEPAAHLDQASASELEAAIGRLAAGRTLIMVTHQMNGLSEGGRLLVVADGGVRELTAVPA
jgi:ATP-binding cassette subfamily C protein CydD